MSQAHESNVTDFGWKMASVTQSISFKRCQQLAMTVFHNQVYQGGTLTELINLKNSIYSIWLQRSLGIETHRLPINHPRPSAHPPIHPSTHHHLRHSSNYLLSLYLWDTRPTKNKKTTHTPEILKQFYLAHKRPKPQNQKISKKVEQIFWKLESYVFQWDDAWGGEKCLNYLIHQIIQRPPLYRK